MEIVTPPSSPRQAKNLWLMKTLDSKFAPTQGSRQLTDYRFSDEFSPKRLKDIKSDAGRGFTGRLGSFKAVVEQAENTNKLFIAYNENKQVKKGLLSKKTDVTGPQLIAQFEQLIKDAQEWRGSFDQDGSRQKTGKFSDTTVTADKHRAAKMRACDDMIRGARIAIAQVKALEPAALLQMQAIQDAQKNKQDDLARQLDAELLQTVSGAKAPTAGTSDVSLIKAPDGSIAYAFKSVAGESDQTGMPKGAGAVRELMMSRLCDQVKDGQDLDFNWPKTTLATMKDGKGTRQQGVLIEGLKGDVPYLDESDDDPDRDRNVAASREMLEKLPARDIQKLALCNMAFGQYDIKWDNAIVQKGEGGDDSTVAPFDGGAAFPTMDLFMDTVSRGITPGATLTQYGKDPLKVVHEGRKVEVGETPMDPELVKMFLSMDEGALEATAKADLQKLSAQGLDPKTLGMNDGVKIMVGSIRGIKKLLRSNPKMTMFEFIEGYKSQVMKGMADDFRGDWDKDLRARYTELQKQHPTLLAVDSSAIAANDLNIGFLSPEGRTALKNMETLGGAAFVAGDPIKATIPFVKVTPRSAWLNLVLNRAPADVKQAHPDIFKTR